MAKVLCFGELLLRISPTGEIDEGQNAFQLYVGGAEANTATALSRWNIPVKYCTAVPDTFVGSYLKEYLRSRGIDVSPVFSSEGRMGTYYLDIGADLKSSVVYDRAGSAFSELKRGMIDWDKVLKDVSWFNLTAISPALGQNVAEVCVEALQAAADKNIRISVDLNYRSKLWKYGKEPLEIMPGLVEHADLVMGNIWSANSLLGISIDPSIHEEGTREAYLEHARVTSAEIIARFPKCSTVANTFRFDSNNNRLLYYTSLYTEGRLYSSAAYTTTEITDRSGSGDCFMAGLIYGSYRNLAVQQTLDFATAAAFGKLQEPGDSTRRDEASVLQMMATGG